MDPIPSWQVWRNRRGRIMGVAIVFRASDIGLEIKTAMSNSDNESLCEDLCVVLNEAYKKKVFP